MNKAAYAALYRDHYAGVLALCRRLLGSAPDAEDAAQEAFARGFRARSRYRSDKPFSAWINTIASRHCIDLLRRRDRVAAVWREADDDPEMLADADENGVGQLISAHRAASISAAVEQLPLKYRVPVVLAYSAGASYDEIAATLDVTVNHVGVLLSRGKARLRRELAHLEGETT